MEKMLDENGVSLSVDHDLAGDIWENRPVLSCEPVTELDIKWAGESRADKCARIRKAMEKKGADLFVLTSLDDIAWLLNIRGGGYPLLSGGSFLSCNDKNRDQTFCK